MDTDVDSAGRRGVMARRRRGLAFGPWLAVLVVAALLNGAWSEVVHEETYRHVRCDEHGELTHVTNTGNAGVLFVAAAAHQAAVRDRAPDAAPSSGHAHCQVLFATSCLPSAPARSAGAVFAPPPEVSPAPAQPRPASVAFLLRRAPKTSPPVA